MFFILQHSKHSPDINTLTSLIIDKVAKNYRLFMFTNISDSDKDILAEGIATAHSNLIMAQAKSNIEEKSQIIPYPKKVFSKHDNFPATFVDFASHFLNEYGENLHGENNDTENVLRAFVAYLEKSNRLILIQDINRLLHFDDKKGICIKDRTWLTFFDRLLSLPSCNSCIIII